MSLDMVATGHSFRQLLHRESLNTTRLTIIVTATVSQPLLPVLLLGLHIYPLSVFCFQACRREGVIKHATWGERILTAKDICAQATVAIIIFFLSRQGTKNLFKRRRFLDCFKGKWEAYSAAFFPTRRYHGLARASREKEKMAGSRAEGCDCDAFTRRDPRARDVAGRLIEMGSRVVVVLVN